MLGREKGSERVSSTRRHCRQNWRAAYDDRPAMSRPPTARPAARRELRVLELIRHRLDIERLIAAGTSAGPGTVPDAVDKNRAAKQPIIGLRLRRWCRARNLSRTAGEGGRREKAGPG